MKIDSSTLFFSESTAFSGVKKIASRVMDDCRLVTGVLPTVTENVSEEDLLSFASGKKSESLVIYGTLGKSPLLDLAAEKGLFDPSSIKDRREVYSFSVHGNLLVIAGSDKRGTIYGLFHLSDLMGVSPLVDWADLLPVHQDSVELSDRDNLVSKEPSVKYRGLFINDEWPAYGNWTFKRFGGFTAEMYGHVFELLLRMKGNYMWPAMWSSRFSDDGPGLASAELADELGVIMGASHHEPCCRAGEEYKYLRGPGSIYGDSWNFIKNREGITRFWEDGLKRSGKFENVITVGMRGEADTAIMQNATLKDNIDLLRDVLKTQNGLIRQYVNPDLEKVPRMLALYKEVEPYFYGDEKTPGLINSPELEGVTLMLCEDNQSNLRTVPTEEMRGHKGGYGMYYHFDYHGSPYSYEWFNTAFLPKVKEQMTAAYDSGIQELWIVNMGDIATNEFSLNYFLDLAYDYPKYSALDYTTAKYTEDWVRYNFGSLDKSVQDDLINIILGYTKLTGARKTESLRTDTFHPENFGEWQKVFDKAESIYDKACEIRKMLENRPEFKGIFSAFYEQIYLPAAGNMNVFMLQMLQGKNHWYAEHGIVLANDLIPQIEEILRRDEELVEECNTICEGKWYGMALSEHFGFRHWNEEENLYPVMMRYAGARKGRIIAWIEGTDKTTSGLPWSGRVLELDSFKNPDCCEAVINLASGSYKEIDYSVEVTGDWLKVSKESGVLAGENGKLLEKLTVSLDRALLSAAKEKTAEIRIKSKDSSAGNVCIRIAVDAETVCKDMELPAGTFVKTGKYISIEAAHASRFVPGTDNSGNPAEFVELADYGKTLSALKVLPAISYFDRPGAKTPVAEYDFAVEENGKYQIEFYCNPSNPATKDNYLAFSAGLNGEMTKLDMVSKDFAVGDNQEPWSTDIVNNIRIVSFTAECRSGLNTLKVGAITPNFVLEKIVIHPADYQMPQSYFGAPETYRV